MTETRLDATATLPIRRARPDEADDLMRIAKAAKGHWGYDAALLRDWPNPGEFTAETVAEREFYVAELDGRPVAWSLVLERGHVTWLSDLWVDPEQIGRGIGSRLFAHAAARARELGATALEWESEPNAVGFYEKLGGRYVRDSKPSDWGRVLPVMRLELGEAELP